MNNIVQDLIKWYEEKQLESTVEILIAILIIVGSYILSSIFSYFIIKIFTAKSKNKKVKQNSFYRPLKIFFVLLGFYIAILILKLPESIMYFAVKFFKVAIICLVANGITNMVKPDSFIFTKLKKSSKINEDKSFLIFISKFVKIIVYIITAFVILAEFGYDLNGVVTGLGLGSVVIALAAQDVAKSIFAGIMVFIDKPFSIGDFIEVKDYKGTVEDIKFRSTKLRLLDGSLLTVPNEVLTTESITNWTIIHKRRYELNLELVFDTSLEKVSNITKMIKEVVEESQDVIKDTVIVNFNDITANGMNINIYMYTSVIGYEEFLNFKQNINLKIMKLLEEQNISLAYPSQDIYIKK